MKTDPVAGALGDYRCFVDCAKLSAHRITNREEIWLTKRNAETLRALALHNLTASTAAHHAKAPVRRSSLIATVVTTSVREISDTRRKKGHTKAQKTQNRFWPLSSLFASLVPFCGFRLSDLSLMLRDNHCQVFRHCRINLAHLLLLFLCSSHIAQN